MTLSLLLAVALTMADASGGSFLPPVPLDEAVKVPELAAKADVSFLVRRWDRAIPMYEQLAAANPTVGLYWYRLGVSCLADGQYDKAIAAFTKSNDLGAYQWHPLRIVYRGESAFGLAAAHARLEHRDEAIRWTRTALAQGLRDLRQFHGKHFEKLLEDSEYRKLVWKIDTEGMSREDGYRLDLAYLMHEARRLHYAPFRTTSEPEIESLARQLGDAVPNLTDDQVLVRLMALVSRYGDGHTQVGRGAASSRLPIWLFRFPEGLYITAALEPHADLVGAKVLTIGDRRADEAVKLAEGIVSRDNLMTVVSFTPMVLGSTRILRGLGITSADGPVPLEIEDASGAKRRVELTPVEPRQRNDGQWIRKVAGRDDEPPPSERRRESMYWFEPRDDERMVYCQINGIGDDQREPFRKFCARLFEAVEKPEIDALVLDLRHNGGGNTFVNVPLIEGLIRSDKLRKPGHLFVIIGRLTFSAAQNTTSELERRTGAILVGEPTGSSPNFIGESLRNPLPYSGWNVSISDLWWQHSMSMDYRVWTNPQLYAPPTAEAFRAHRDTAMETIARYRATMGEKK